MFIIPAQNVLKNLHYCLQLNYYSNFGFDLKLKLYTLLFTGRIGWKTGTLSMLAVQGVLKLKLNGPVENVGIEYGRMKDQWRYYE